MIPQFPKAFLSIIGLFANLTSPIPRNQASPTITTREVDMSPLEVEPAKIRDLLLALQSQLATTNALAIEKAASNAKREIAEISDYVASHPSARLAVSDRLAMTARIGDQSVVFSVGSKGNETRVSGPLTVSSFDRMPEVAYSLEFDYRCPDGLVQSVILRLHDHRRTITISGPSEVQVDAVTSTLRGRLSEHATLGGLGFRYFSFFVIVASLGILVVISSRRGLVQSIASMTMCALFIASPFLFPWEHTLPGFVMRLQSESFLHRHGPLFTFLSFLFGLPTILEFGWKWIAKHRTEGALEKTPDAGRNQ